MSPGRSRRSPGSAASTRRWCWPGSRRRCARGSSAGWRRGCSRPVTRYSSAVTKLFWASFRDPGGSRVVRLVHEAAGLLGECLDLLAQHRRPVAARVGHHLAQRLALLGRVVHQLRHAVEVRGVLVLELVPLAVAHHQRDDQDEDRREGDQQDQAAARPLQRRGAAAPARAAARRPPRRLSGSAAAPAGGPRRARRRRGLRAELVVQVVEVVVLGGGVLEAKRRRPDRGTSPVLAVSSMPGASRARREKRRRFGGSPGSTGSSAKAASKSGRSSSKSATATREWMIGSGRSAPGGGGGVEVGEGGLEPPSSYEH